MSRHVFRRLIVSLRVGIFMACHNKDLVRSIRFPFGEGDGGLQRGRRDETFAHITALAHMHRSRALQAEAEGAIGSRNGFHQFKHPILTPRQANAFVEADAVGMVGKLCHGFEGCRGYGRCAHISRDSHSRWSSRLLLLFSIM